MLQRHALLEKDVKVKEIKNIINKYRAIGIASLYKVRASQLQELKKKMEGKVYLRVVKSSLISKVFDECKEKPGIEKLKDYLKGSNIFLFTNINPFNLAILLEKNKVKATAKSGDIATEDVIVPAGNTGFPPGPIISQLGSVGLSTRIESGSVWINRDVTVAKKGEVISERLAVVLSKLGIKPIEIMLNMKVIYDDGFIVPKEVLQIDLKEYENILSEAFTEALNLSLNAAYPTAENIVSLIKMAHQNAYNLTINVGIPTHESTVDLIRNAYGEALVLKAIIESKKIKE